MMSLSRRMRVMRRRQIDARSWVEGERSVELVGIDERTLVSDREEEGR